MSVIDGGIIKNNDFQFHWCKTVTAIFEASKEKLHVISPTLSYS